MSNKPGVSIQEIADELSNNNKLSLPKKLVEVRKHIGILRKTQKGQNGNYIDPAELLLKATDKMNDLNVFLTSNVLKSTLSKEHNPTKTTKDNHDFVVSLEMEMVFYDGDSDEKIVVPWFAFGKNTADPSMAGGSALTYYERYFFMKQFNVPTTKDDPDFLADRVRGPEFIDEKQAIQIVEMMDSKNLDHAGFFKYLSVDSASTIPAKRFDEIVRTLNQTSVQS